MSTTTVDALREMKGRAAETSAGAVGNLSEKERLDRARRAFLSHLDGDMATYLESCIHCGMCAEACHFQIATRDPHYTPIYKVQPLLRFYRREVGPMRWLRKLTTRKTSMRELEEWQPLVYDACTQCGRCSILCPMGIHIQQLIGVMREGMAAAGLAPEELAGPANEQAQKGTLFGAGAEALKARVESLRSKGVEVPLDKPKAETLVLSTAHDLIGESGTLEATARVMNHVGTDWTVLSSAYESANFGAMAGDAAARRAISDRVINAAVKVGAKRVVIAECGHAYPALRWDAATIRREALPFEVLTISEYLAAELDAGRLKLRQTGNGGTWAYQDGCKMGRLGGALEEPRKVLSAMGIEIREMESHGRTNLCCGGGGGVILNERAKELRQAAFGLKREDVDGVKATDVAVSCGGCRATLETGKAETHWDVNIHNLVEMVADRLA
jgi:Fe-S oxidoreductase